MNWPSPRLVAFVAGLAAGALAFRRSGTGRRRVPRRDRSLRSARGEAPIVVPARPAKSRWWRRSLVAAAVLLVLGFGGFILAASGIVPIKASGGHWAITRWFLQFSKERSVATHTLGMTLPEFDQPWMVLKGAGHYETGCVSCHGSPQRTPSHVAKYMLPQPPSLQNIREKWDPAELFYIVKHGIKLTGMPAWPGRNRDDEVWAMVAFLLGLPELTPEGYHRLVQGAWPNPPPSAHPVAALAAERCARCHGPEGNGRESGAFPKLAGQRREYLLASLQAYAGSDRPSGLMEPVAAALTQESMHQLADYYSRLPPESPRESSPPSAARGREIAYYGIPHQQVPACAACHLPKPEGRNPHYPNLTGQYADYLELQLKLFKKGNRGGTAYAHIMEHVARRLTDQQIQDVSAFFSGAAPGQAAAP